MPAVMRQTDIIRVKIFPCPIKPGQLTITGIFEGNIVSGVIPDKSDVKRLTVLILFALGAHMKRKVHFILRHPECLVRRNNYLNRFAVCHIISSQAQHIFLILHLQA